MTSLAGLLTPYVLAGVRRRQALTIAALLGLAQYFVRAWSPPEIRAVAYAASPEWRAIALAIAWLGWMRMTRALAWRLVVALDVRHLRHLPISPWQWRITHALQLGLLDAAVAGVAGYGLWPLFARDRAAAIAWWIAMSLAALTWRVGQCAWAERSRVVRTLGLAAGTLIWVVLVVLDAPTLALACAGLGASWAIHRLGLAFAEPRASVHGARVSAARHPALAVTRLWLGVTWHLDRGFVQVIAPVQVGLVALSNLACVRVGRLDPAGARAAVAVFATGAAALATWSALRTERRIAPDRWAIDPLLGSRRVDVVGRALAAAVHALPMGITAVLAAALVDHGMHVRSIATAIAAIAWSAMATLGIAVSAQARDVAHEPTIRAQVTRVLLVGIAAVVVGPAAFLAFAAAELALAWRRWPAADRMRRRRYRAPGEAERD